MDLLVLHPLPGLLCASGLPHPTNCNLKGSRMTIGRKGESNRAPLIVASLSNMADRRMWSYAPIPSTFPVVFQGGESLVVEAVLSPAFCVPGSFNRGSTPPSSCTAWKPVTTTSSLKEGFCSHNLMEACWLWLSGSFGGGGFVLQLSPRSKVMRMMGWWPREWSVKLIVLAIMKRMWLRILDGDGFIMSSLMPVGCSIGLVLAGILLCVSCIASLLLLLGRR